VDFLFAGSVAGKLRGGLRAAGAYFRKGRL
jgi:hypothetical protein